MSPGMSMRMTMKRLADAEIQSFVFHKGGLLESAQFHRDRVRFLLSYSG